nr:peptidase M61 [Aquimarina sp. U1-2]
MVNVVDDKVKVEIQVSDIDEDTISYYLPKIVPGTYQNNDYGKFIEDLKVFDKIGNQLPVEKYGNNRWKINNATQIHKLSYWVNDTFDTEDSHDIFSPTGSNISKNTNFVLNLYAFVGYFTALKEVKYKLFIKHPKNLAVSASSKEILPDKPIDNPNYDVDYFVYRRYADVVDSPLMYSSPNQVTFTINGIEILLSVYSPNHTHTAERLKPEMERMIRAQSNFIGNNIETTKNYSILLYLSTTRQDDAKGFGALEHSSSTVAVLPESLSLKKLNAALTDVISHEFFHILTPINIHSEEIHNFDYNNPKMSQHLWLYEGTTEYFSLLFQITQGLITKEQFLERILDKIETSKRFDDHMSFALMSENILKAPFRENYRNVYEKGALISMCIDIMMRENSDGIYGILDLIKNLSTRFGQNTPFKDDELIAVIEEVSYPEVSNFLKAHVIGNQPIDYNFYLDKVGVALDSKEVASSYFIHEQQPFVKGLESSNQIVFVTTIPLNSFLKNIGVKGGDILSSINDKAYTIKNIYDLFGDSNAWKVGDKITFRVKRNGKEITLQSTIVKPTVQKMILKQKTEVRPKTKDLFKKWIND